MTELKMKSANLWLQIKSQCLESGALQKNPFARTDAETGQLMITCPRCGAESPDSDYTVLSVMPRATLWSVPIRKCNAIQENGRACSHLFAVLF